MSLDVLHRDELVRLWHVANRPVADADARAWNDVLSRACRILAERSGTVDTLQVEGRLGTGRTSTSALTRLIECVSAIALEHGLCSKTRYDLHTGRVQVKLEARPPARKSGQETWHVDAGRRAAE
jgi:hypothetical protein